MTEIRIATRREFLVNGLGLIGVGAALPSFLVRTALAGPKARAGDRVLVVLQLSGGHDGLSAVVPYSDDDYARNRSTTRIAADAVLKINDSIGLHPNLTGCRDLLDQHAFAVVQGVGYPNPNRSHFKSMDIWHLADNSGKPVSAGWLGRYCDDAYKTKKDPKIAIALGSDRTPRALQGSEYTGISLQQPETYRFFADRGDNPLGRKYRAFSQMSAHDEMANPTLQFVGKTAVAANASSDEILKLAEKHSSKVSYPRTSLGTSLHTVAALIAGGLTTRIYYVFQGGFDTHSGQKQRHDRLMTELSDAVVAFQKDLTEQGNAKLVLTMSFSEFGRRVRENGSQGTDHGTAGPMFLFGPAVKPGLHDDHPSLAAADLDHGDLQHKIDFRSIYATMLEKWLGTGSEPVLGAEYPLLDCLA
jgi:uncharacterized protein (DUF1501 family)